MDSLLDVHEKYHQMVLAAFCSEPGFIASLDRACREVVNRNKVCSASSSKTSELLARYTDSLLRKSSKNAEESELESLLNQTVSTFRDILIYHLV